MTDYLEKFDKYSSKKCDDLPIKERLRTGYKTKSQLQRGLDIFSNKPITGENYAKLKAQVYPEIEIKERMGYVLSAGQEQERSVILDSDSESEYSFGGEPRFQFEYETQSEDSPPQSQVDLDERVGMALNQLIAQYEMGRLTQAQFSQAVREQQDRYAVDEVAPTGEERIVGYTDVDMTPPPIFQPRPPMGQIPRRDITETGGASGSRQPQ